MSRQTHWLTGWECNRQFSHSGWDLLSVLPVPSVEKQSLMGNRSSFSSCLTLGRGCCNRNGSQPECDHPGSNGSCWAQGPAVLLSKDCPLWRRVGQRYRKQSGSRGTEVSKDDCGTGNGRMKSHRQIRILDVLRNKTEEIPVCPPLQILPILSSRLALSTFLCLLSTPIKMRTKERNGREFKGTRGWGRK